MFSQTYLPTAPPLFKQVKTQQPVVVPRKPDKCAMLPLPLVFYRLHYVNSVFHLDRIRGWNAI